MQVGRKVVFAVAANVAGAVLGYGALLVIGRSFAPAAYGSFLFASGLGGLFALATTLGLGAAQQRLVARGEPLAAVLGTAARLRLALLTAGLAVAGLLAWVLHVLDRPVLTDATTPGVLAGALAVQVASMARQVPTEAWAGRQQVTRTEAVRLLDATLLLVLVVNAGLLVSHLAGRWTPLPQVGAAWANLLGLTEPLSVAAAALLLVGCTLVAKVASTAVALVWATRDGLRLGPHDPAVARQLWSFGLPVALTGAVSLVVQYTDVILLGFFWTATEVGLYGTAQKLAILAGLVATAASGVLLSRFAQLSVAQAHDDEARTSRDAQRWLLLVVAPLAAGLIALAGVVLHIAVGDAYLDAAPALRWLALAAVTYALQVPLAARFMGHGQTRVLVQAGIVNAVANLVLNLVFIPQAALGWGPQGAAVATFLSGLLAYAWLVVQARRSFGIPWVEGSLVRALAAGTVVGTLWWQLATRWPPLIDRVWELAGWGLAGALTYLVLLAALGGIERRDWQLVRRAAHPVALWQELRGR